MLEQQRNASGRDERRRGVGRDRHLAVTALRLEAALDDRELAFGVRLIGPLAHWNMHADALVIARIVEIDANADERLLGALLETRLRLDPLPVPHVGAMDDLDAAERPALDQLEPFVDRSVDENVTGCRRVVVTVPYVAAANDPCQLRYVNSGQSPRDGPLGKYRADTDPPERRCGHRGDERALRARDDAQGPLAFGGCERELLDELRDFERLGVRLLADLQRRSAVLDVKAVHKPAEELATVETARDQERDVRADELRLPQQRLLAVYLLRRDA